MPGYSDDQNDEGIEELVEEMRAEVDMEDAVDAGVPDAELERIGGDAASAAQAVLARGGSLVEALRAGNDVYEREIAETERRLGLEVTTDA